ncbi:aminodeoxychorismate synthase component I [Sphingomonas sp. RT2P30]|uniref:aminodeoxychorismate synthase component I n=1 Tax=Parasphingomonas halimpatiens TaxID=3096162 RepID=UPI002FC757AB
MLAAETQPFILLDDARPGGAPARLYRAPLRMIVADTPADVPAALAALRAARREGLHAAGYLAYEAGAALQPRAPIIPGEGPILWFGIFDRFDEIAPDDVPALLPDPAGAWAGAPRPVIDRATYDSRLARVQALIEAGDIYQANLTYRATVAMAGDPLALYARLRAASHAGYGAIVATGAHIFLSLSPELFFALEGDRLTCRPMKGTAPRGATPEQDRALAAALASDAKQRAENLMIVDLMRNDLSRVAAPGSVAVPELFAVETYPTVLQMTSTVTATLDPDKDAIDVLTALFPCGSITGAPKSRAMEVIGEVEATPRGLYTGSIGRIDASGDAMFNVAIRTLAIAGDSATLGLGSGIVADSTAGDEWAECAAKGAFVTTGQRRFDLIETMAFDPEAGIPRLERHLTRMKASADVLGFTFDRHDTRNELQAATFRLRSARRIRLVLSASGAVAIEVSPLPAPPADPVAVAIVPLPVATRDFRLRHKTSDRAFYDAARAAGGAFEAIFVDPQGFLTEGSFTSLFVAHDGVLLTPPLARRLLPGVLRAELIDTGQAIEAELTPADLAGGFFIGNALRGLMPAIVAVAK